MTKTTKTASTCPACKQLARVGIQCNTHRRMAPNARTLTLRAVVAHMNETGCTAAEAEAHFGLTAGPVVG